MKIKISFRSVVTILSIIAAIILGLTRIADPELVEVMRLKYFDVLQKKYPRNTDGQTYSVIVDIDEKSLREVGQWPWPRTVLADLFQKSKDAGMLVLGLDVLFAEKVLFFETFSTGRPREDCPYRGRPSLPRGPSSGSR